MSTAVTRCETTVDGYFSRHAYSKLETSSRKIQVDFNKYMLVGPSARRFLNQYFALPKKLLDCSSSDGRFQVFERSTRMHGSAQVQQHGERCTLVLISMDQARFARLTAEDREQPEK